MQVYVELALLENFCMDFTLLYSAKAAVKNRAGFKRIAVGAVFGACFAVAFPLFKLPSVWAVTVKILSGLALCAVSGRFKSFKGYLKFTGAFLGFTAILGGALIGIFALSGNSYSAGQGYILSSAPVGIPMFGALLLIILAKKIAARLQKSEKREVVCTIFSGGEEVKLKGFFDSGNKVYMRGSPVSVIPSAAAEKLLCGRRIEEGVKIHTVAGSRTMSVFTADKIEIDFGEKKRIIDGVRLGISPQRIDMAVLHCDLLEG